MALSLPLQIAIRNVQRKQQSPLVEAPRPTGPPPKYLDWLRGTLPAGWTADAAHIRLIAEHVDKVMRGEIDRLAIHMPPRHAKTETTTIRIPVYALEQDPKARILVTGYNERFARKLGRRTRNIARDRVHIAADKQASDEWYTTQGGLLMARGVGSPPTGEGFTGILIDDPIRRREDADSEIYREKVWDWYTDDLYTRLEPDGWIIMVMTRWHEDDAGARAVASEPGRWTVLSLPAIALEGDPLGRAIGEPLWPERYSLEELDRIKQVQTREDGARSWEALYQQNPTPREGDLFKVGLLNFIDAKDLKTLNKKCRAWDLGGGGSTSDPSASVKMAEIELGGFVVLDVTRGRWDPAERNQEMRQTAAMDGPGVKIHLPQDPGQAGKDQAGQLVTMLAGYPVKAEPVSGDKVVRADPFASQVNAGNVWVVRGPWNRDFVEELRSFPNGKHDDQVDAASDAFTEIVRTPERRQARSYRG